MRANLKRLKIQLVTQLPVWGIQSPATRVATDIASYTSQPVGLRTGCGNGLVESAAMYRDDKDALVARNDALERELASARRRVEELESEREAASPEPETRTNHVFTLVTIGQRRALGRARTP